jgi:hypothetical protein
LKKFKDSRDNGGTKLDTANNDPTFLLSLSKPVPFSLLDPVRGVGILEVERPVESRPFPVMKALVQPPVDHRRGRRVLQDDDKDQEATRNSALPTNAWYQNLLLLSDDDKPERLHRAYALPYVVDTVGPIPGLRVQASVKLDVTVDENIVQTSTVDPYAFTIGASLDFNQLQGNDTPGKLGDAAYHYSVIAATNLGITLQWVRQAKKSIIHFLDQNNAPLTL